MVSNISDNTQDTLCKIIQQSQSTSTLELVVDNIEYLVPRLTEALKCPSESLKSFTFYSDTISDRCSEIVDVLSTNTTLTEIGIGLVPSTAVNPVFYILYYLVSYADVGHFDHISHVSHLTLHACPKSVTELEIL